MIFIISYNTTFHEFIANNQIPTGPMNIINIVFNSDDSYQRVTHSLTDTEMMKVLIAVCIVAGLVLCGQAETPERPQISSTCSFNVSIYSVMMKLICLYLFLSLQIYSIMLCQLWLVANSKSNSLMLKVHTHTSGS